MCTEHSECVCALIACGEAEANGVCRANQGGTAEANLVIPIVLLQAEAGEERGCGEQMGWGSDAKAKKMQRGRNFSRQRRKESVMVEKCAGEKKAGR